MESHFGVVFDCVALNVDTKKKLVEIRNNEIKEGQDNFTITDAITKSVNAYYQLQEHAKAAKKLREAQGSTGPFKNRAKEMRARAQGQTEEHNAARQRLGVPSGERQPDSGAHELPADKKLPPKSKGKQYSRGTVDRGKGTKK